MRRGALPGARTPAVMPRTPPAAARITRHAARSRSIQKMAAERFISLGFLDCATGARNDEVWLIASLSAVLFQDAKTRSTGPGQRGSPGAASGEYAIKTAGLLNKPAQNRRRRRTTSIRPPKNCSAKDAMSRTIIDASVAISSGLIHWRATLKLMFQGVSESPRLL